MVVAVDLNPVFLGINGPAIGGNPGLNTEPERESLPLLVTHFVLARKPRQLIARKARGLTSNRIRSFAV